MSTLDTTPGVEMIGGSLGHGLGQGVGQALGLRLRRSAARVFVELSDGEMQEGSTWEAAMAASHFGLDNLVALIDCNGIQADGPVVLDMEPVRRQMASLRLDTAARSTATTWRRSSPRCTARAPRDGRPKAIVLRTLPGKGVPRIEQREKSHFFRVDVGEWDGIIAAFEQPSGSRHDRAIEQPARTLAMGQDEAPPVAGRPSRRRSAMRWRELGDARGDIVGLTADLGKYTDIHPFRDAFPDRFFNVGMAEQNLDRGRGRAGAYRARRRSPPPMGCSPRAAPTISSRSPAPIPGST